MIKRLILIAAILLTPSLMMAQNVTVTGTITDTAGVAYVNGTLTVTLTNTTGQRATFGGSPSFQQVYSLTLDSTGSFTVSLPPNSTASPSIQPAGTQWNFSYSSQGGYGAANANVTITGSMSVTSNLSNLARIQWPVGANPPPSSASGQVASSVAPGILGWGSASSACVGRNCFLLQSYPGYFGDSQEILNATWTGASTAISTATPSFSATDNGKLCWGSPQSMQGGPATPGTFTFISATSGTCAASGSLIGAPTGNGMFTWGHDDTAAYIAATAALYTQPKCGALIIPAARTMIKQGVSYTGTVASDCAVNIGGSGYSSVIEIEPGFSPSTTTNSVGCQALGCFWNTSASTAYLYFTVTGEYQSMTGISSAPASALFTIGPGSYSIGVNLFNWGTAFSNTPQGTNINGTGPFGLGFAITNWGDGNIWCSGAYCIGENDGGNSTLKTQGNSLAYDYAGTYAGVYTSGSGAETHLYGTASNANNGGFGAMSCDFKGGEKMFLVGAKPGGIGSPGSSGIGFQFNNTSGGNQCILDTEGSTFNGGSSGSAINSAAAGLGQIVDHGGNTFNGPMTFSGTYTNLTALNVQGACTGVATASSTLGLYGTGPNETVTTCTSATIGTGIVMNKNYTIYELLANSTAAGVNGSSGAVTVLLNGATQTMTCTIGTGTSCQDGATAHRISGSPGDRISLQFTSQAADTLAGVKATLVIE